MFLNLNRYFSLVQPHYLVRLNRTIETHEHDNGEIHSQSQTLSKLGGEPAALGVLHTWSRQLVFHPHLHYIVPGGFLSENRLRWIRLKNPQFLLPERVLSRRARNLFRTALQKRPELFAKVPCVVWKKEWVVNTQAVGSGEKALGYLANYVQRTALSSAWRGGEGRGAEV